MKMKKLMGPLLEARKIAKKEAKIAEKRYEKGGFKKKDEERANAMSAILSLIDEAIVAT